MSSSIQDFQPLQTPPRRRRAANEAASERLL
jgi:hypothetical protein